MVDISHLVLEMKQGRLPTWSPALIMRNGEELDRQLDQRDLMLEANTDQLIVMEKRLIEILVAFGALDENDHVTGPLDLLEILLPPQEPTP